MTRSANMFIGILLTTLWFACRDGANVVSGGDGLGDIPYNPRPYTIPKPAHFPPVPVPPDNPMTYEGVQLGRHLFYDPILSGDSSMSCASCHLASKSFADAATFSVGIDGIEGKRNAMSLLNIAYVDVPPLSPGDTFRLFWDGRARTLEHQVLFPVEDEIELHTTWPSVIDKLKRHDEYPAMFRKAFGIERKDQITKELAAKAIAQFERILISSGTSVFDRYENGETQLIQDETLDGLILYREGGTSPVGLPDAECFHCHGSTGTLTGGKFFNNGLDPFDQIQDFGLELSTRNPADKGKFRAPTLRNIAVTGPYMHDGRFKNLEQVIDFYLFQSHPAPGMDANMLRLINDRPKFSTYHRDALVKFLHTLTDTTFMSNPDIQNPFQ
jgi:cytochrome c peroxidase